MYKIVKRYYDRGIYSAEDVARFVAAGKITEAEYQEIIGGEGNAEATES